MCHIPTGCILCNAFIKRGSSGFPWRRTTHAIAYCWAGWTSLNVFMMSMHMSAFTFLKVLGECTAVMSVCVCTSVNGVAGRCTSTIEPPACLSTPAHPCCVLWGNLPLHTEMGHYFTGNVCVHAYKSKLVQIYLYFSCLLPCLNNCWWYSQE